MVGKSFLLYFLKNKDESEAMYTDSVIILVSVFGEAPHYTWKDSASVVHLCLSLSGKIVNMCLIALIIGTAFSAIELKSNY